MIDSVSVPSRLAYRLTFASIGVSVLLLGVLAAVSVASGSKLALAEAADSLSDVFTAGVLLWAIRVSAASADEEHPFGHHGAQPIAALIVAVLAGVLAVEVLRASILGLVQGQHATLDWTLAAAFTMKVAAKAGVVVVAYRGSTRHPSPALDALRVDAVNDVAVGTVAVAGYFAARYGHPSVDAWLAIPVALWIGATGLFLALENIKLLMGQAPPVTRQSELEALAATVPGVRRVCDFKARHHGTMISVRVAVAVDEALTVRAGHDIGERVEHLLLEQADVSDVAVHVDVDVDVDD